MNNVYQCDCEIIHEDVVKNTKEKMLEKDTYIELASLLTETAECAPFAIYLIPVECKSVEEAVYKPKGAEIPAERTVGKY